MSKPVGADDGVPIRDIGEVIARHLDLRVVCDAPEDEGEHFAWLARLPLGRRAGLERGHA